MKSSKALCTSHCVPAVSITLLWGMRIDDSDSEVSMAWGQCRDPPRALGFGLPVFARLSPPAS